MSGEYIFEFNEADVEMVAKRLHATMEHLDPSDKPEWGMLTERERDFYETCAEAALNEFVSSHRR